MKKYIDFHLHTTASDSSLSVTEVLNLAMENNMFAISITDHNTLDGILEAKKHQCESLTIIEGIELSALHQLNFDVHILGYCLDISNSNLNRKLDNIKLSYLKSLHKLANRINRELKIDILGDLKKMSKQLKRKNMAEYLFKNGYVATIGEAYTKYLSFESASITPYVKLSIEEAIKLILDANGIPCLAHPITLEEKGCDLLEELALMKSYGLMGIEVYHPLHSRENELKYLYLAQKFDLIVTGGSDHHGNSTPERAIGKVNGSYLEEAFTGLLEVRRKKHG